MSFSSEVKKELEKKETSKKEYSKAEMVALLYFSGEAPLPSEDSYASRKFFTLLRKTFNIRSEEVATEEDIPAELFLQDTESEKDLLLRDKDRCKAFLRGAFLRIGSVSDPAKSYQLEFVCKKAEQTQLLLCAVESLGMSASQTVRKGSHVVYVRDGSVISDLLSAMEAYVSMMKFENVRAEKEFREQVNRKTNCETANIVKTGIAAGRQAKDISFLMERGILQGQDESLIQTAILRLEYPEATYQELGEMFTPPVGKSCINHRLRKLSELAESYRKE